MVDEEVKPKDVYSNSDRLGIALACLTGVMAIILFLVEKTPIVIVSLLGFMIALSIFPILHFFRSDSTKVALVIVVVVGTVIFGRIEWPKSKPPLLEAGKEKSNIQSSGDPSGSLDKSALSKQIEPKSSLNHADKKGGSSKKRSSKGIVVGNDSVAVGNVPDGSKIGDRSVVVGSTDAHGNTILNKGGTAIGNGAKADATSVAIGENANAGATTNGNVGSVAGNITQGPCSNFQIGNGNQGTVNCTDVPPQINATKLSENVPANGPFETKFRVSVVTQRAFLLHARAVAQNLLLDSLKIDDERPAGQGGKAFSGTTMVGPGYIEEDFRDIESGNYFITVQTSQPSSVSLECH